MQPNLEPKLHFGWKRRLPIVMQADSTECGLACLAMIAGYYGQETDLLTLRRRFPPSLRGMNLARLIEIGGNLGFAPRPLRVELEDLSSISTPCILHWNLNHYVVLKAIRRSTFVIHDPTVGERVVGFDEMSRRFTGVVLELSPTATFQRKKREPGLSLWPLLSSIRGLKAALAHILLLAVALEFFALLSPLFLQTIADRVLVTSDRDLLALMGIGFIIILLVQTFVSALRSWLVTCLGLNLNLSLTNTIFAHLLRLPESYFQLRHVGDIASRFGSIGTIQQTISTRFVEVVLDGALAAVTVVVLFAYNPKLAFIAVMGLGTYAALRVAYYPSLREATHSQLMAGAQQQSFFLASIRGVRAIKIHNQEAAFGVKYTNHNADVLNKSAVVQRLNVAFAAGSGLVFGLQRILVLWIGAGGVLDGRMTIGALLAFVAYNEQLMTRASALVDYYIEFKMLRLQGERIADIVLSNAEERLEERGIGTLSSTDIELRNVGFRYTSSDPWVVRGFNLKVRSGESVALVGASGIGKSTIAKLIVGLLDPSEGEVLIGGVDVRSLGKQRLREICGVVMQDDQLFAGSIFENITFFDQAASPEKAESAARAAAIHDDIHSHPLGYQALVGDMGSSLSGGQKQRVVLARALYRRPQILVLDEATSHLDLATEFRVSESIRSMKITRILIAHRPETIASADTTVQVGGGPIADAQFVRPPLAVVE